jgi:C1A family cysteine protease
VANVKTLIIAALIVVIATSVASGNGFRTSPRREGYPQDISSFSQSEYAAGLVLPPFKPHRIRTRRSITSLSLPERFDWREQGVVTPVGNQGAGCGACFAFAALGNIESSMIIAGDGRYDFSENNIKECEWFRRSGTGFGSCKGGTYWWAVNYLAERGTVLETCDPYLSYNATCKTDCSYKKTVLGFRVFTMEEMPPVELMKTYVMERGPIYVAIDVGSSQFRQVWNNEFQNYDGSYTLYFTGSPSGSGTPSNPPVNHAVLIVGWDDTLEHAGGQGGWIAKNSWGTSWGGTAGYGTEGGFFTIAYGSANIGYYASFVTDWMDYDPCSQLLFHDEAGYWGELGYEGSTTAWGMCKFMIPADGLAERVEFWTTDPTTDVDVYLYDDFDGSRLSNQLASAPNSSYDELGYHSVELSSPVAVEAGDDIYVAVKITNVAYTYPLSIDPEGWGPLAEGMCYISFTGSTWIEYEDGDIGIRLRIRVDRDCDAPDSLSFFRAIPGDGRVTLDWTNPVVDDFSHVLITYSPSGYPRWPDEGEPVDGGTGKFSGDPGAPGSFEHTGLTNNVTYYYSAFSADTVPNYSKPGRAKARPGDQFPPGPVTLFSATGSDTSVMLRWTNPGDDDLTGVMVRYSADTYPGTLEEGLPVYGSDGILGAQPAAADSFRHTGLWNDTTYYYTIWAFDTMEHYSAAESTEAIPVDDAPPEFAISVFQNPYVTHHLDIYVIPSEPIVHQSLVVTVGGEEVATDTLPGESGVARCDYRIGGSGVDSIVACGSDLKLNDGCSKREYAATLVSADAGGLAVSADGGLLLDIPGGLLSDDLYVLVTRSTEEPGPMICLYDVSPTLGEMAGAARLAVDCKGFPDPEHLCLARFEDGDIYPLDSYVDRENGRIVAYTSRFGTYGLLRRPDATVPDLDTGGVKVFQNVPNPFSGTTRIGFAVAGSQPVAVGVFSVKGRLVKNLLDRVLEPGMHSVAWDGTDEAGRKTASGIYFYRITTPSVSETRKMILLR